MKHTRYTNKYSSNNLNDWIIHCDICGKPIYHSEATLLPSETGRGGLLVCSNDADMVDYGLVPYDIPNESVPTETRINTTIYTADPETRYTAFDYTAVDPMSYNPEQLLQIRHIWDQLTSVAWEDMTIFAWEQLL